MKRGTKLLILMGTLVLLVGAFLLVMNLIPEENTEGSTLTVFQMDPAKVTKFGWKFSDEANFTKTENGWVNDADSAFPVNGAYIEKMLTALTVVNSSKTIEKPADLDQYGLKNPYCTIKVTVDGKAYDLAIGNQNEINGLLYFSNGDGNVYMVDSAIAGYFNVGPEEALLLETIPNMTSLTSLKVENGDKTYEILFQENSGKTYSDLYKWFWNGTQVLDTELTEELLKVIYDLEWKSCPDYNVTDLAQYGLDAPTVVTVTYQKDKTFVLELGNRTDSGVCARIAGSKMVYYVGYSIADTLRNLGPDELKPDEVLAMEWDTVTSMDITIGGVTYTLTSEEMPDTSGCATGEYVWKYNGKEVDAATITDKLDEMDTTGAAIAPTEEHTEEIRFVFHRKTSNFSQVELVLYSYTSTECLVTLDGEPTVKADRSDVTALLNAVNKLFSAE